MTPAQIRDLRERLGLTQNQAARLVGVDTRSWRRWESGQANGRPCDTPEPVARLLRLVETLPAVRKALEGMAP